jgi:hypothetical protein
MWKDNERKRWCLISRLTVGVSLTVLIVFSAQSTGSSQDSTVGQSTKTADQLRKQLHKKVKGYPDIPVSFENFDQVPVFIHEANVKEITNTEYYQLTGIDKGSSKYTTFPNVRLTNNTDQRITGLTLMVGNKQTRQIQGVKLYSISIEPHGNFIIKPSDWVRSEKTVRVSDSGRITTHLKPTLESEKMWFAASVADLVFRVGAVEFESGQNWVIDQRTGAW